MDEEDDCLSMDRIPDGHLSLFDPLRASKESVMQSEWCVELPVLGGVFEFMSSFSYSSSLERRSEGSSFDSIAYSKPPSKHSCCCIGLSLSMSNDVLASLVSFEDILPSYKLIYLKVPKSSACIWSTSFCFIWSLQFFNGIFINYESQ